MKYFLKPLFLFIFLPFISACEQTGLYDFSTPETTYETYREQAKTLSIVADHRHYRRIIRCFTDDDWSWFAKNYEKIPAEREEGVYENLYRTKQMAYVFGRGVVPLGPPLDENTYKFIPGEEGEVILRIEGYPRDITFIEESRGWVISGLFGVREQLKE